MCRPLPGQTRKRRPERVKVLVLDDSVVKRNRSKAVELLARVYDHVEHKYQKGFTMLTLGWSDGYSFVPVGFSLLSSAKKSNRYQGKPYTLPELRRFVRFDNSKNIFGSIVVATKTGIPVKIVIVRNCNKKSECLYLLGTDCSLSDSEIVRIYGNRWSIECYFKASKSFLNSAQSSRAVLMTLWLAIQQLYSPDIPYWNGYTVRKMMRKLMASYSSCSAMTSRIWI